MHRFNARNRVTGDGIDARLAIERATLAMQLRILQNQTRFANIFPRTMFFSLFRLM
jgi:hypothetical protein